MNRAKGRGHNFSECPTCGHEYDAQTGEGCPWCTDPRHMLPRDEVEAIATRTGDARYVEAACNW